MAIGAPFFYNSLEEPPINTLPPLPSKPKLKKKKSLLDSPELDKKKLGSKKKQRLSNLQELLKIGETMEALPYNYIKFNYFENLNQDYSQLNQEKISQSTCKVSYRLCFHEKNIRNMIKRTKYGYERVKSVETSILEFISQEKPGQLSFELKDSFERLLIHILCRYYHLDSLSIQCSQGKQFLVNFNGNCTIPLKTFCEIFY